MVTGNTGSGGRGASTGVKEVSWERRDQRVESRPSTFRPRRDGWRKVVKPIVRLVRMGSTPRGAYTFRLSTW
jgi:hypothetical protein